MSRIFILVFVVYFASYPAAIACSSFQLNSSTESFVAKNYDWRFGEGFVIYNPALLEKSSVHITSGGKAVQWSSKHSSLTFNQYGLDFPNGGMNDTGLTIEVLWLDESVFPPLDGNPYFNELQWIQYALDTQSSTADAVKSLEKIRIQPIYGKVHYFICDNKKKCAVVEYVDGAMTVGNYDQNGYEVLTNSTYQDSVSYLRQFKNFGGNRDVVWNNYLSLDRFVRLNEMIRRYGSIANPNGGLAYSFQSLDTVKKSQYTQWQIVYDKAKMSAHFKTTFGDTRMGSVLLKAFPGGCKNRYYFDMSSGVRGDLNSLFQPLTESTNYALVKSSLKKLMPNIPESLIQTLSQTPFKFKCQGLSR